MEELRLSEQEYEEILAVKRDLHMYPELSGEEFRTTRKIREFLEQIPGIALLDLPVRTGAAARIEGEEGTPEVLLRADIDALPRTETYDSPWKSRNEGVMHACGHDFHTASLLGAARILSRMKREGKLRNTVDLLFQPHEEGTKGARMMIDAGLFDVVHPDCAFGLHNWPSVDSGMVVCHGGPLMAGKRNMKIAILGSGGHGSMPHLNRDPIVCAASVVTALQTVVSRNTSPLDSVVLSVNMIQGGGPANIVADRVELRATLRALSESALDRGLQRIGDIVRHTAAAFECGSDIEWEERIPPVCNSREMLEKARRAAASAVGEDRVTDAPPSLASEDFALYGNYVPSFFFWVGSRTAGEAVEDLHRPGFHTDDAAMREAAALYAACGMAPAD